MSKRPHTAKTSQREKFYVLKMYHRFSCASNGQCEANPHGEYPSLLKCGQECQAHPLDRDTMDLAYHYAPGSALHLAPSDQVRIIRQITGLTVKRSEAERVLKALEALPEEGVALVHEPLLWPYLRQLFGPDVFQEALYDAGTFEAWAELRRLLGPQELDYKRIFMAALRQGNCALARQIDELPGSYVELEEEDFHELHELSDLCVLEYLLEVYGNDHYNEHRLMEEAARTNNVNLALLILQLPVLDFQSVLDTAALAGGLPFMERLAREDYYQHLESAAQFGAPFLFLALENYKVDPYPEEVYRALEQVRDPESVELLFSLLGEPYEPSVWTVAQGLYMKIDALVAPASDKLRAEAEEINTSLGPPRAQRRNV
jgi:hypothetical protein